MKTTVLLALQVSVVTTVFGFALNATWNDLLYLIRRPGLLVRSLLSMFVIMPALALLLVHCFDFQPTTEIVVIALAISPVPPLLPMKHTKGGGSAPYGLGLMLVLGLVSIVVIPGILAILDPFFERELAMPPVAVAKIALISTVLPLLAGSGVRALWPALADRLARPVGFVGKSLLAIAVLLLLVSVASSVWALVGTGTILVMTVFAVTGLAIGHVLGGPDPGHSVVLGISTACRHPALAFAVATTHFPDQRFGPTIVLYLLVSAIVAVPYLSWRRRHA
jgi:BASS family bile acid:Na+ symporter